MFPTYLQFQVIDGRKVQVGSLKIGLSKIDICSDHIKRAMPQYSLKREDIAAIAKVAYSECVPEGMRRTPHAIYSTDISVAFYDFLNTVQC